MASNKGHLFERLSNRVTVRLLLLVEFQIAAMNIASGTSKCVTISIKPFPKAPRVRLLLISLAQVPGMQD